VVGLGDQQLSPKVTSVVAVRDADVTMIFKPRKARVVAVFSARSGDPVEF
jgi:hypothetical protein